MEDIFKSLNSKQAEADKLHPGNIVLRDISNTFVHITKMIPNTPPTSSKTERPSNNYRPYHSDQLLERCPLYR